MRIQIAALVALVSVFAGVTAPNTAAADGYRGGYADDQRYGQVIDTIVCESHRGRVGRCAIDTRYQVVLSERYSRSDCIEGHSWGVDRGGVWVSNGCRAAFSSIAPPPRRSRGRGNNYGNQGVPSQGGYAPDPAPAISFRCESHDGQTAYCGLPARGAVQLSRQLSRTNCSEGYNWGVDRRGVWVTQGCRAEFTVY